MSSSSDTDHQPLADVLAARQRPVTPEGVERAGVRRAAARKLIDPAARKELIAKLRAA